MPDSARHDTSKHNTEQQQEQKKNRNYKYYKSITEYLRCMNNERSRYKYGAIR